MAKRRGVSGVKVSQELEAMVASRRRIIKEKREKMGLSEAEVARRVGISQPSYHNIENGPTKQSRYWSEIEDVLELDLRTTRPTGNAIKPVDSLQRTNPLRDFPVYFMQRGHNGEEKVLSAGAVEYVERPALLETVREAFGICISGEENYPVYKPGDVVFVHPYQPAIPGYDVVVRPTDETDMRLKIGELRGETETEWQIAMYNRGGVLRLKKAEWGRCCTIAGKYNRR